MGLEAGNRPGPESQPATGASGGAEPAEADSVLVRAELERILESKEFLGSDRARRFLRYVVEETLQGRADRIKAFSVAIAAFDRDESFDPQTDPIVRIEAGRLRRSLERYYLVAGAADPVRIDIPKGTYVPSFTWPARQPHEKANAEPPEESAANSEEPARRASDPKRLAKRFVGSSLAGALAIVAAGLALWTMMEPDAAAPLPESRPILPQPSVAVLPLSLAGGELPVAHLSSGMTSELIRELARYSSIFVLGPQSVRRFGTAPDVTVIGEQAGVGFVLSGSIQHVGERIRVAVQLNDTDTGGVVWAEAYERDFAIDGVFDLQTEIARDIVRRIAQPQGAIALFDWKRTRGKAPETWDAYDCVVQADDLRRRVLPPSLAPEIQACLRRAVQEEPDYADGWMMSALIAIDAARFVPLALTGGEEIRAAHAAAQRAVELAPDSGRAHLALMMALYFQGRVEEALAAGETALRLSPHDPDILGEVALRHINSGDLSAGVALLHQSIKLYQGVPLTARMALAMAALREGRYQDASDAAEGEGQSSNFVYWSMVSAFHGKAGKLDKAKHAATELLKLYPDFPQWAWAEMKARRLAPEVATAMAEGWRAAGLPVPLEPPAPQR